MNAKTPTASCWSAGTSWWMAAPQAAASRVRTASSITAQSGRGGSGSRCKPRFLREQCVRATRLLAPGCTNAGKIQPKPRRIDDKTVIIVRVLSGSESSSNPLLRQLQRRRVAEPNPRMRIQGEGEAKAGQHLKTPRPLDAGAQEAPRHITHRDSGGCPQNFEPWLPLGDGALCKEEGGGRREARQ